MGTMEVRYEEMNRRNIYYKTPVQVHKEIEKGRCFAAYALGDWYLQPSFVRLISRLQGIVGDSACLYKPIPGSSDGKLHQTLLQYIKFERYPHAPEIELKTMECVSEILSQSKFAPWIQYRGLVWTPSGLALAGYSEEEDKLMKLRSQIEQGLKSQNLPCEIPYVNDILHATVLRWTSQPDAMTLYKLEKEVERWSECVFGELRCAQWTVGKGSWRMRDEEREDYFGIPVHTHICHRGNLHGSRKELENNFGILIQREIQGQYVEVDVWYIDQGLWIGHDKPDYKITFDWLASSKRRLLHAKDGATFSYLMSESGKRGLDLHIFYHTEEDYVLTSKGLILGYPGKPILPGSLCMMPERAKYSQEELEKAFWICSDFQS